MNFNYILFCIFLIIKIKHRKLFFLKFLFSSLNITLKVRQVLHGLGQEFMATFSS